MRLGSELTSAVALRLFRKELSASQVKAAHALIRKAWKTAF